MASASTLRAELWVHRIKTFVVMAASLCSDLAGRLLQGNLVEIVDTEVDMKSFHRVSLGRRLAIQSCCL